MGFSIWQLIIILFFVALVVLVYGPVIKKAGFSRWWSLILVLPLVNLIAIWVFAFVKWPSETNA